MRRDRRQILAKRFEPVTLLKLPGDVETVHAAHTWNEQSAAELTARELSRNDFSVRLTSQNVVNVIVKDATAAAVGLILLLRKKGLGIEQLRGLDDGLLEILMLEGMQGVVMHKHADGALRGQIMRRVIKHMPEALTTLVCRT